MILLEKVGIDAIFVEVGAGESYFRTFHRLQGVDIPEGGKLL